MIYFDGVLVDLFEIFEMFEIFKIFEIFEILKVAALSSRAGSPASRSRVASAANLIKSEAL